MKINAFCLLLTFSGFFISTLAFASDSFLLVLENHLFTPAKVEVPAGKKVRLVIENKDAEPEEFDSFDLNREKVLFPGRKSVIYIGPLEPGEYRFFGEFSPNTAQGVVVAKEPDNAS
ncbi:cupredoxin domain-containing protein [Pseudoalteromonas xiamenensis]|uniref:Cupredoxin domain-containing protein n=1 Tax=Pseudoalteromonas xiamenensis TaxID=882626 RepID=A0A975DKA3_9GAMM|nr:cupredoxin domain-containing protein [Pseudoalteromonas xiamenensis]QTH73378.1 cupredoxin domain-containing protein [Pseudoalteromonas xiamenensis]WMN61858.1 cupredoxin domain-containing protein [Pseudoalteromonas xiamenensis]